MRASKGATVGTVWLNADMSAPSSRPGVRIDGDHLGAALAEPVVACVEEGLTPAFPPLGNGLTLRLSSAAIFDNGLAGEIFVDALVNRHWLPEDRRDRAILAIHEALANAVIHGNFEISGGNATSLNGFREQGLLIASRMTDPAYGPRPITLTANVTPLGLEIAIQDCGKGFPAPSAHLDPSSMHVAPTDKKGRGLGLMQESADELRHEDGGRRTVLFFRTVAP